MARFVDANGKEWVVQITAGAIRRVSREIGITLSDLTDLTTGDVSEKVLAKYTPDKLVDAFYALMELQVKARGISKEDFLESLDLQTIIKAVQALTESITTDFPKSDAAPEGGEASGPLAGGLNSESVS